MIGFLVTATKTEENGGGMVAKWADRSHLHFFHEIRKLEKEGKAVCIFNNGGYPYQYTVKAGDIIPLIKKELDERDDFDKEGSFLMLGYDIVPDAIVTTTKDSTEMLACSADETLLIELWDLS
jgi:hypothetical protein